MLSDASKGVCILVGALLVYRLPISLVGTLLEEVYFVWFAPYLSQVRPVNSCKGICSLDGCEALPKRPQYHCMACHDGQGAYYHLDCFFKRHPHVGAPLP